MNIFQVSWETLSKNSLECPILNLNFKKNKINLLASMLIFKKILSQNNKKIVTWSLLLGSSVKKILTPSQNDNFLKP
jgi:hypothetical protein